MNHSTATFNNIWSKPCIF